MTVGSLFAGIGGLDLGLERAGMEVRWQVEIDDYCRKVLAKHWPDVTRYKDVRDVGAHNLETVDLICGGFPCQDISYAGKGAGIEGERSGLWYEFARIIREIRPQFALVENVPAILTRGLGDVLGTLASCGYDAEWDCIPAAAVGAPHRRDRFFLVAYPSVGRRRGRTGGSAAIQAGEPLVDRSRPPMADTEREGLEGQPGIVDVGGEEPGRLCAGQDRSATEKGLRGRGDAARWWLSEPDVGRVADGVSDRVDRLRALGNAVVPQVAEWIGRRIMAAASATDAESVA